MFRSGATDTRTGSGSVNQLKTERVAIAYRLRLAWAIARLESEQKSSHFADSTETLASRLPVASAMLRPDPRSSRTRVRAGMQNPTINGFAGAGCTAGRVELPEINLYRALHNKVIGKVEETG
jgi:hypothetical protein